MEFVNLIGRVEKGSCYITFEIKGGDWKNCIGDQLWISKDGTEMEVSDMADQDVYDTIKKLFGAHKRAFMGAMLRMDVEV